MDMNAEALRLRCLEIASKDESGSVIATGGGELGTAAVLQRAQCYFGFIQTGVIPNAAWTSDVWETGIAK